MVKKTKALGSNKYFLGLASGVLLTFLVVSLLPKLVGSIPNMNIPLIGKKAPTPTIDIAQKQDAIGKTVLPESFDLGISYGDAIVKMIQYGAIDKDKFMKLYADRGGLSADEQKLLDQSSNEKIVVTPANAGLVLNLLWPLGIANKTQVLSLGPMGTDYKKDVGNFASTGGWTLGKEDGGKLFNKYTIVPLSPAQEDEVKEISQNIYRPCCGNSTFFPDCNHGAAMLGFIELAVAQGMPKDEIYKKALMLNSLWFPQTYVELAIYFEAKNGKTWDKVDPKEALSVNYSSGQGYAKVNKELQSLGLLPEVQGGGSCGV